MKIKRPKAVLFDFDGVIADTMPDNFLAWKKAFRDFGIKIEKDDYYSLEGYSTIDIAKIILEKFNKKEDPKKISELKHHYYMLHNKFKLFPYITRIIRFLKKKEIPTALVTGANKKRVNSTIPKLINFFPALITGDDNLKSKPDPDPYIKAAKLLMQKPKDCIVIENAPLGIQSAKAAGCYCIGLTTTREANDLKGADKIFDSHSDLLVYFQKILK